MPNYGAKVSSAYISSDAIREFLAALPSVMRDIHGDRPLTVSYQWGCNLHNDLCFTPMCWPLDLFSDFLADSIDQKIVKLGESELLIESADSNLKILVCHESDIHLDGTDDDAVAKIMARFPEQDFRTAADWKAALPRDENSSPQAPG